MSEKKTEEDEAEVINEICCIQNSSCHVVKMLNKREIIEDTFPYPSRRVGGPVQNPEE
jgi:hypothetical protein